MVNSLFFGDSGFSFNLTPIVDAGAQTGLVFASVPNPMFRGQVTLDLRYTGVITAILVILEAAQNNVDAQFREIARSVALAGETLQVSDVPFNFYRVKKSTSTTTGGTITAELSLR